MRQHRRILRHARRIQELPVRDPSRTLIPLCMPNLGQRSDDYAGKPFHCPELAARVDAVLRRSKGRQAQGRLQIGELRIDPVAREAMLGQRKVELSAKEFALPRTLATEPTRVFTKEELLRDVWGFKLMITSRRSPMIAFTREEALTQHAPSL